MTVPGPLPAGAFEEPKAEYYRLLVNSLTGQMDGTLSCSRQDGTVFDIIFSAF